MQDRDQYIYFTIKLLKGSFALSALWQDALNYHMVDQPDKLIAMRLTEYYELVARGALRPGPSMVGVAPSPTSGFGGNGLTLQPQATTGGGLPDPQPQSGQQTERSGAGEMVVSASSPSAEQNAEEAADYWAPL